jgi:DNA recombination protein RmuC
MDALWILVGLFAGGLLVFFMLNPRLGEAKAAADSERTKADQAEKEKQKLAVELEGAKTKAAGIDDMKAQFVALSTDVLREANKELKTTAEEIIGAHAKTTKQDVALHKEQIEKLLQPVGNTLEKLEKQIESTNIKRAEAETELMTHIRSFASANEKLAVALNKPVIRGSWAETKLEMLLEAAGLVRDEDFELQVSFKDGDQTRIVDALVKMPQGKRLVIDSKNLMHAFVEYANADDGPERDALLALYRTAFRSTLKGLSIKDYSKHFEGIDAVIMFLPDEGMYMAAVESDRQLIASMYEHRVYAVSPISLLPILKSVSYILGLERQNKDMGAIVEAGRNLYASLGVLSSKVTTLGGKILDCANAYNGVIGSFEGNVLPKARELSKRGVKHGAEISDLAEIEPELREFKGRTEIELEKALASLPSGEDEIVEAEAELDGERDQLASVSDEA